MNNALDQADIGKFLLRFGVGFMMLFHGYAKITGGVGGIQGMLESAGLPGFMAYGVYLGEVVAPLFLILGLYTRISAAVLIFTMFTAIYLAHGDELFAVTKHGALALEVVYFYIISSLAIIFLGSGKYSIDKE
ncbi:MAG: DoxX family protein [Campylobacterota bacterium]